MILSDGGEMISELSWKFYETSRPWARGKGVKLIIIKGTPEDDCFVVWIHRGNFPFLLGDLLSLEGEFEIYHADCMLPVKEGIEVRKEVKENERTNNAGTDKKENI